MYKLILLTLLTSCSPSYHIATILYVDLNNLKVEAQISERHFVAANPTIDQLDTLKKGQTIHIQKKTLIIL